jgi:hypothetical protein
VLNDIFPTDRAVSSPSFILLKSDHFSQTLGMEDVVIRASRMRHLAWSLELTQADWAILLLVKFEGFDEVVDELTRLLPCQYSYRLDSFPDA